MEIVKSLWFLFFPPQCHRWIKKKTSFDKNFEFSFPPLEFSWKSVFNRGTKKTEESVYMYV